jgi:peptidoglycan/LPS O-acetylase OafA/YrhL
MPAFLGLQDAVHSSYLAVDFFFCLSGFVVAFAYERRLRDGLGLAAFLSARLIRLYPVYLLATVVGLGFVLQGYPFHSISFGLARFLLLIAGAFLMLPVHGRPSPLLYPLDFPAWSLFFELCANAAFAVLIAKGWASRKVLLATSILSLVALLFWKNQGHPLGAIGWESTAPSFFFGFPRVALSFALGVGTLYLYKTRASQTWNSVFQRIISLAVALSVLCILFAPFSFMRTENFNLFAISILFPVLVFLGARVNIPASLHGICEFLGKTSYPLYLLHIFFVQPLSSASFERYAVSHSIMARITSICVVLIALVVSYVVARFYETPVRELLTRAYNKHRKAPSLQSSPINTKANVETAL